MKHVTMLATCLVLLGALVAPSRAPAQEAAPAAAFSQADLEQIVAPIALYPDSLLMQIFMGATYPLEVVEASRWLAKNPGLTGAQLEEALKGQSWDPSVKALCGFPDVVKRMADNLDWTQDLGDAVLGQEAQLMDAVQIMRGKAYESGNLKTTEQQTVTQQPDKIIVIESSDPEVIYVPTYSPSVVYVGWGYPSYAYPALYPAVRPGYGALAFTAGVAWGAAVWGDANWGWGGGDVNIDIDRQTNFNRNTNINANNVTANRGSSWNHDASHRKGVNYRDSGTAQKYGGSGSAARVSQTQARGRSTTGASATARPAGGAGAGSATARPSTAAGARPTPSASQRPASTPSPRSSSASAYSGSRSSSSFDRSASSRGASSRGTASYGGARSSSAGASRGGGGGARGGGRR